MEIFFGARERSRTSTLLRAIGPKPIAYTISPPGHVEARFIFSGRSVDPSIFTGFSFQNSCGILVNKFYHTIKLGGTDIVRRWLTEFFNCSAVGLEF